MKGEQHTNMGVLIRNGVLYSGPGNPATIDTIGAVKPDGVTTTVDEDGTIHAQTGLTSVDWDDVNNKPSTFPPSDHNHDTLYPRKDNLQEIVDGDTIIVNGDGTLTSTATGGDEVVYVTKAEYDALGDKVLTDGVTYGITDLPAEYVDTIASTTQLGVVKVDGTSITVNDDGVIKANYTNPNLLDNPWFTVNQRKGKISFKNTPCYLNDPTCTVTSVPQVEDVVQLTHHSSSNYWFINGAGTWYVKASDVVDGYVDMGAYNYTIDRWKHVSWDSGTYLKVDADGIILSKSTQGNRIHQIINHNIPNNTPVVLSIDATLYDGYFEAFLGNSDGSEYFRLTRETSSGLFNIPFNWNTNYNSIFIQSTGEIKIRAAKLELSSVSTLANDIAPDYNIELLKCITSTADASDTYANKRVTTYTNTGSIEVFDAIYKSTGAGQWSLFGGFSDDLANNALVDSAKDNTTTRLQLINTGKYTGEGDLNQYAYDGTNWRHIGTYVHTGNIGLYPSRNAYIHSLIDGTDILAYLDAHGSELASQTIVYRVYNCPTCPTGWAADNNDWYYEVKVFADPLYMRVTAYDMRSNNIATISRLGDGWHGWTVNIDSANVSAQPVNAATYASYSNYSDPFTGGLRNMWCGTGDLTAGSTQLSTGAIYMQYE